MVFSSRNFHLEFLPDMKIKPIYLRFFHYDLFVPFNNSIASAFQTPTEDSNYILYRIIACMSVQPDTVHSANRQIARAAGT